MHWLRHVAQINFAAVSIALLNACSAANPLAISWPGPTYTEPTVVRGVVNGLWQYDVSQNIHRLQGAYAGVSPVEVPALSARYQVRVGINRSAFVYEASEVAVLPEGWTYSLDTVTTDGRTINVGDVVELRGQVGTNLDHVVVLIRKCNSPPDPGERKDWNIGCKKIEHFDSRGYGGEKYYLTGF